MAHSLWLLVHELGQKGLRAATLRVCVANFLCRHLLALLLDCQLLEELLFRWERNAQALILVVVENEVSIGRSFLHH